jgi:hypothetical protein
MRYASTGSEAGQLLRRYGMRRAAIAATLLSFAFVGGASAQQMVATNPVTGAATGFAAGAAQGAAVAGPVGALVGAPLGLAGGTVAGTLAGVGTLVGYNYCPAGYTPVTPPGTLSPAITGIGYCAPAARPVAVVAPRRALSRVAYRYPHRVMSLPGRQLGAPPSLAVPNTIVWTHLEGYSGKNGRRRHGSVIGLIAPYWPCKWRRLARSATMSFEVMAYEKALHDYREAEDELQALIATVARTTDALLADPLGFDVSTWPTPEEIAVIAQKARMARQELRETWAEIPDGVRAELEAPPEEALWIS